MLAKVWCSHHREFREKLRIWVLYFNLSKSEEWCLKLTFRKYSAKNTNYIIPTAPLDIIILIFDTVLRQKGNLEHEK